MKNQRGITLIALVVTIVVLLILAGTSIAMLGGENGIITHAQDAAAANTEGEAIDKMDIAYNTVKAYVITKSSTLSDWEANDVSATEGDTVELTVAKVIAKEILPKETLTEEGEPKTYKANGDGYTVVYTPTKEDGTAGTVTITYADKTFNNATDGKHYKNIVAKMTINSDDVEYERPARQVNQ